MLPLKAAFLIVTFVPFTEYSPLQPLVIEKPPGTVKLAVQPLTLFPELFVMVSSAVPHFLPFSSQELPAFHENENPLAETEEDCGRELAGVLETAGVFELTGAFELDELPGFCAVLEPGVLLELGVFAELGTLLELGSELTAALELGGISDPEELCKLLSFEDNDPVE